MKLGILFVISVMIILAASFAGADCKCLCINGEVQAVCSSSLDLQPLCPPRICPLTPPSIEPLKLPSLPPLGTSKCVQQQVYNERTGRYEWREVCY